MCARCETLQEELERIRQAASIDLQSLSNDIVAKNREIGRLKKELSKQREEEPDSDDVMEVLRYWKEQLGKRNITDIGPGGKRYKIAQTAVKRWGKARCLKAIDGLAMEPYAGPRGRSGQAYPGSKRWDDLQYALGDEVRFERMEEKGSHKKVDDLKGIMDHRVGLGRSSSDTRNPGRPKVLPVSGNGRSNACQQIVLDALDWKKSQVTKYSPGVRHPIPNFLEALGLKDCRWMAFGTPGKDEFWMAQCPSHDDSSPSLKISEGDDGRVLFNCHAGCDWKDVIEALEIEPRELWAAT